MTKPVCLTLSSLCWCLLYGFFNSAWAFTPLYYNTHAYTHALELKPIPFQSYKIAKSVFLPDFKDSEFGIIDSLSGDYSQDNCAAYTLSSCPSGANCSSCPFDAHRFKFNSCKTGYKLSGSSCIPSSCSTLGYSSYVPSGQVCTKITQSGLTCYKGCRNVSCSGYSLSCSSKPANSSSLTKCPDCNSAYSNCSTNVCKIAQCYDGYKIANNGTSCIPLDDTCPDGYFKTCDTGIESTVSPTTTEAGTKCYKCRVLNDTCPNGYFKTCESGTRGDPVLTEAGSQCWQCKTTASPECSQFSKSWPNNTVILEKDITCTDTIDVGTNSINGQGHTITFVFEDRLKNGLSFRNYSNSLYDDGYRIENLNIVLDASNLQNNDTYTNAVISFNFSDSAFTELYFNNVNISANITDMSKFYHGYSFIYVQDYVDLYFEGTNTFTDLGSVCTATTGVSSYPRDVDGISTNNLVTLTKDSTLDITLNSCNSIALNNLYLSGRGGLKMEKNSELNITTNGVEGTDGLEIQHLVMTDATINITSLGEDSTAIHLFRSDNSSFSGQSKLNIISASTALSFGGYSTESLSVSDGTIINVKGIKNGAAIGGHEIKLYNDSQLNTQNVNIKNTYLLITDNAQANILDGYVDSPSASGNSILNIQNTIPYTGCFIKKLSAFSPSKVNLICANYLWMKYSYDDTIITVGTNATINTSFGSYTCTNPNKNTSCRTEIPKKSVILSYLPLNTNNKLTKMPDSFTKIFSQGIFAQ